MTAEGKAGTKSFNPKRREDRGTQSVHDPVQGRHLEVKVDDRGLDRAIRKLRRLTASEGVLREMKRRRHHEKPSQRRKRKSREAARRRKRRMRRQESY